jgi:hypothetical protein
VAAFKFATWVVLATVNGAVPVVTVDVITPEAETVVKAPVDAVVAPMDMLLIVPTLVGAISIEPEPAGFMWTWPVPVGLMSICALVPFRFVDTLTAKLSPPPAPINIWVVPVEFFSAKPPEPVAWTVGVVTLVDAVAVVNAPVVAVVAPIVVPSIAPPVTATEFAFCVDIVPKPVMSVFGIVADAVNAVVPAPLT